MAKPKTDRPLCVDGTLAHHLVLVAGTVPHYHFHGPVETGKLIETTYWACTKCPHTRQNEVEVILDDDD